MTAGRSRARSRARRRIRRRRSSSRYVGLAVALVIIAGAIAALSSPMLFSTVAIGDAAREIGLEIAGDTIFMAKRDPRWSSSYGGLVLKEKLPGWPRGITIESVNLYVSEGGMVFQQIVLGELLIAMHHVKPVEVSLGKVSDVPEGKYPMWDKAKKYASSDMHVIVRLDKKALLNGQLIPAYAAYSYSKDEKEASKKLKEAEKRIEECRREPYVPNAPTWQYYCQNVDDLREQATIKSGNMECIDEGATYLCRINVGKPRTMWSEFDDKTPEPLYVRIYMSPPDGKMVVVEKKLKVSRWTTYLTSGNRLYYELVIWGKKCEDLSSSTDPSTGKRVVWAMCSTTSTAYEVKVVNITSTTREATITAGMGAAAAAPAATTTRVIVVSARVENVTQPTAVTAYMYPARSATVTITDPQAQGPELLARQSPPKPPLQRMIDFLRDLWEKLLRLLGLGGA